MEKFKRTSLPCPEVWVDPAILPLVTLLNRLGFETVWSCAGYGVSRSGVEPPISRLPVKIRRHVKIDGDIHYVEAKDHHFLSRPYVTIKTSDHSPEWLGGVLDYLGEAKIGKNDLYIDRFSAYSEIYLVETRFEEENNINIYMSDACQNIIKSIAEVPVCKEDIVTIKEMWLHEMVKAFSFI